MALVLPSTVEELNFMQNSTSMAPPNMYVKESNKGFENIAVERRYKREASLPNGVENWNIGNFEKYLNFDDNHHQPNIFEVIPESQDDRLVPEEGELRQRCESFSSMSSNMEDKYLVYRNLGVKTYNTVCVDSGSTCISSEHNYVNSTLASGLDASETYQNLDTFFGENSETHTDTISSITPVGSPINDSNLEYSIINQTFSVSSNCSQDSFSGSIGLKRSADQIVDADDIFLLTSDKRTCESPSTSRYYESRKKNNMASKNCRKTRKEKQKEMEAKATELKTENEQLNIHVATLEAEIKAHKLRLYAILRLKQ